MTSRHISPPSDHCLIGLQLRSLAFVLSNILKGLLILLFNIERKYLLYDKLAISGCDLLSHIYPVRKPRCLPHVKLLFYRGLQRG
jgi:hypothetical protein